MFTGIVEELGTVAEMVQQPTGARIRIGCSTVLDGSYEGASIAVNGVCLTAVDLKSGSFAADVAPETLKRTNLGTLKAGSRVNLERPMSPTGRLSGHIVQGHVDGTGVFESLDLLGNDNWWLTIRVPDELDRYLVWKGSVAIDGISLTIAALEGPLLSVTIIPHTYKSTTLAGYRQGNTVNLECDVLAKYVEKMLAKIEKPSGLTKEKLQKLGY